MVGYGKEEQWLNLGMITRTIIRMIKILAKIQIHNSPISEMFGFQTFLMPVFQCCPHTIATRKC
jgi:hypothetical protein